MDRKQELIDYLKRKYEAYDFWSSLRQVVHIEQKLSLLQEEIKDAKEELQEVRDKEAALASNRKGVYV